MNFNQPTLFMLTNCPHCHTAKTILKKYKVIHAELNWDDPANDSIFKEMNIRTVPVLFVPQNENTLRLDGEKDIIKWVKENAK